MLDLQPLIRRLELGLRRRLVGYAVEALVWGLLVGAAVVAFGRVVALGGPGFAGPDLSLSPWAVLALALTGSVVAFFAILAASRPTLAGIARRADEVLGSNERISTALEVWRRRPVAEPVSFLLVGEAASLAATLDPRRVSPISAPAGWPYILAGIVGLLSVAAFAPAPAPTAPALLVPAAAELTDAERVELGLDLREIAEIVEAVAARRGDPYLRAVARTVAGLAAAVSEDLDRNEALVRLDELLPQAGEAYSQQGAALDGGLQDILDQVRDRLAGRIANEDLPPALRPPPADPAAVGANEAPPPPGTPGAASPHEPIPERPPGERPAGAASSVIEEAYPEPDVPSPGREFVLADQTLTGGAQNANRGVGDMAGIGVQPLLGTGETLGELDAGFAEVQLPGEPDPRGRLIKVDVTPTAERSPVADTAAVRGPWRTMPVGSVERDAVGSHYLAAVARYFGHRPE